MIISNKIFWPLEDDSDYLSECTKFLHGVKDYQRPLGKKLFMKFLNFYLSDVFYVR